MFDSSAELGLSNTEAAKTFAQSACSQAISTPNARVDDGVARRQHSGGGVAWSESNATELSDDSFQPS
jgi:hypothetical protein